MPRRSSPSTFAVVNALGHRWPPRPLTESEAHTLAERYNATHPRLGPHRVVRASPQAGGGGYPAAA